VRQRAKRAIGDLEIDPRPAGSKAMDLSGMEMPAKQESQVTEAEKVVDVLAMRKRPPYDYGDLGELLGR
jgi:mRNA interferase RelE/StbE